MNSDKEWKDVRELLVRATPEQAWRAWADPEIIAGWFADRAEGVAKAGETLVHVFDSMGFEVRYAVEAAEPGSLLVLRGNMHGSEFEQRVDVEPADEEGTTRIKLTHSGFGETPAEDMLEGIDSGWKLALSILRYYLENHFGHPKTTHFQMRPAVYEFESLAPLFREPESLDRWLTRSAGVIRFGEPVELELWDGQRLTGEVLADSGQEIALTWPQINGVLELKAFSMGPAGKALGLRSFVWEPKPAESEKLDPWLNQTLERLLAVLPE